MKAHRILIVEDDPMLGELLSEILETMGHEVCGIESTEAEAVTAAFRHKPDLLVIDAWLRDGSGVSVAKKVCDPIFIPHLFISGDIAGIKVSKPDAIVVQKPFREADLDYAIRRALEA
jgi:DNA-binding response OmpR family regulator